jgi:hypothetical protein
MRGAVGSGVWFESSVRGQLSHHLFFDTWGPDAAPPLSQTTCWAFERSTLGESQLAALSAVKLVPLVEAVTADGYSCFELTVADVDGSTASYGDSGCSYSRAGATVMLPSDALGTDGALGSLMSEQNLTQCPP